MSIKGDSQRAKGASLSKQPLQGFSGGASDVRIFETPGDHLGHLSPEALARVLATAADFALVLDQDGQVLDFAKGVEQAPEGLEHWPGQSFMSLLTKDSLTKAEQLLAAARAGAPATRWSQLSHPQAEGEDLPVAYLAEGLPHARVLPLLVALRPLLNSSSSCSMPSMRSSGTTGIGVRRPLVTEYFSSMPPRLRFS